MNLFGRNLGNDIAFVAEVGVNHEGDVEVASKLLRLAAEAGADAVKFQSYTPERLASASDSARLERIARFALDEAAHRRLAAEAKDLGATIFSTAVTEDMVPLLDELFPAIKIASGDLTFEPVIRAAARTGKPLLISTGAGTLDEVAEAVRWVKEEIGDAELSDRLVLMQCTSAYPTPIEEANVRVAPLLAKRFGAPVGYSNHVIGPEACLAAIALGACVVEAHFTDRKTGRDFRDHALSFEPEDLRRLIARGRELRASLGSGEKVLQASEAPLRDAIRKGVVAARDLAPGTTLTRKDLMFARPATHFPAAEIDRLPGRRLAKAVGAGELIRAEDLD